MSRYDHKTRRDDERLLRAKDCAVDMGKEQAIAVRLVEHEVDVNLVDGLLKERLSKDHRDFVTRIHTYLSEQSTTALSPRTRQVLLTIRGLIDKGLYDPTYSWDAASVGRYQTRRQLRQHRLNDLRDSRPDWMRDPSSLPKKPPPSSLNVDDVEDAL